MPEWNIGVTIFDHLQTGYMVITAGQRFIDIGEACERFSAITVEMRVTHARLDLERREAVPGTL